VFSSLTLFDVEQDAQVPFVSGRRILRRMKTIPEADAKARISRLAGWALDGSAIRRQYTFKGFPDAVAFIVRLGFDAESVDHHPDIHVNYKRVTLIYSTHSAGGLTDKDFAGAARADEIATAMGAA
jgi:4a-hydroxytetrahydrobiopterin dehydratase